MSTANSLNDEEDVDMDVERGKRPIRSDSSDESVNPRVKKPDAKRPARLQYTCDPHPLPDKKDRQIDVKELANDEKRESACMSILYFMIHAGVPFTAAESETFTDMILAIGPSMIPPTYHELSGRLFTKALNNMKELIQKHKMSWARFGCSIMCDEWRDSSGRHLINFLVNSREGTMFAESVDASLCKQDIKKYALIEKFVERVGVENVIQVVMNNAWNNVLVGKFLEVKHTHLFWTPCAAHCLDMMLEDLGKLPRIKATIRKSVLISGYISSYIRLLTLWLKHTRRTDVVKPAKTRFQTTFITMSRIYKFRNNLRQMFTSEDWTTSPLARKAEGKKVEAIVLSIQFWRNIVYCIKLSSPIIKVLRMVDGDKRPPMGYIYKAMEKVKDAIKNAFKGNENECKEIWTIIDQRWDVQLHRPLHAAGHILNPEIYYPNKNNLDSDAEVHKGLYECIARLAPSTEVEDKIISELLKYKNADDLFGIDMAKRQRGRGAPADWWLTYGSSTPNLQKFAIRILSLTCSSSGCEKNWSVFEQLHNKWRYTPVRQHLKKRMFIKYNRALECRYDSRDTIDPLSLEIIDESSEWLIGRMDEDEDDEELDSDDDSDVSRVAGVGDGNHNLIVDEDREGYLNEAEDDEEGYKSADIEEDDGDGDGDALAYVDDEDDL